MVARLKRIKLKELSFVDAPANPHACVVLFKRYDSFEKSVEPNNEPTRFIDAIRLLRKQNPKITGTSALRLTRQKFPQLFEEYQAEGVANSRKTMPIVQKSAPVLQFEKRIDEVQGRDRCSRIDALRAAAREFPDELGNYRTALT